MPMSPGLPWIGPGWCKVLEAEVREREEGAVIYDAVEKHEEAATLRSEAELLLGYLAEL